MKNYFLALVCLFATAGAIAQKVAPDVIPTAKGNLTIQPVNHADLLLSVAGKTIYVDPTGGTEQHKGFAAPDIILVTDIHGDHFDAATITELKTAGTVIVAPAVVTAKLTGIPADHIITLKNGDSKEIAGFRISAIPMYNLPESTTAMHTKGRGNGYVIKVGGKSVYISGDTQGIPEMRALKNIDVAFVCMNLPYTMDVPEAADAVLAFAPKIVYPYHYRGKDGLADVSKFKSLVDAGNKGIDVRLRDWYAK